MIKMKDLDATWTKEETDYFWELCKCYDLRFIIIHDRYDESFNRSVEELKNRYYSVSKRILEVDLLNNKGEKTLRSPYIEEWI